MLVHLVVKLRVVTHELRAPAVAPLLWTHIGRRFQSVLACLFMPSHPHLIVEVEDVQWACHQLADICGRVQRTLRWPQHSWMRPAARVIESPAEFARQHRYVALNECRAGLARDPLEAIWSTYRELFGAVANPMTDPARVRSMLRRVGSRPDQIHAYVSGDPSCAVAGTPAPHPHPVAELPCVGLGEVALAAAAATRGQPAAICRRSAVRRTFVSLAQVVGWRSAAVLARACGVDPRSIARILVASDEALRDAALMCLGDTRLLSRTRVDTHASGRATSLDVVSRDRTGTQRG